MPFFRSVAEPDVGPGVEDALGKSRVVSGCNEVGKPERSRETHLFVHPRDDFKVRVVGWINEENGIEQISPNSLIWDAFGHEWSE